MEKVRPQVEELLEELSLARSPALPETGQPRRSPVDPGGAAQPGGALPGRASRTRKQALTMTFRVIVDHSTSMNLRAERRESRMEGVAEGAMMLHLFALEAGLDHAIVVTPNDVQDR